MGHRDLLADGRSDRAPHQHQRRFHRRRQRLLHLCSLASGAGLAARRPRQFGNQIFFSVWEADELFPPAAPTGFSLLSSSDAVLFASAAAAPVGLGAREGELAVRASGEHWLAVPERTVGSTAARQTFCRAPASTLDWSCWSVPAAPIESPALFDWKGVLYVAGKRDTGSPSVAAGH